MPSLCTGPTTVIHGEFTVHNVLWHRGRVVPVDWESAACAAGEIDLALLLDEWDTATISACTESYSRARWPNGADPAFPQRLDAAWYYVLLRWLADCTDWTTRRARGCLRQLHRLAQRRGVIS